jgi:uncharacterized protein
MIKLAGNLVLPTEVVTQTLGILAKRRAGKSYTARRFAEQLFKAKQQVVVVDPKGDWWGIRSSADGKAPGLPIVILGGERGDAPLEVGGGEIVAKLVVEDRVSALLDLSLLRKHEVATFTTAFLENLYRLKAREVYRTPVMLIVDEADAIAPQSPMKGEERMLGAAEDIVRRGGQRGIGCMLITQRSAVLNKNVLTQVQMLVCLRTIAPQDLKAVNAWIDVHGSDEERQTLMGSLPSLPVGDGWFWSPGWPTTDGIFTRAKVLPIETFDSGATPKPGEKRREPKNVADIDLEAIKRQMAATIERAKADDPKLLKQEVLKLRQQIKQLEQAKPAVAPPPKPKEISVLTDLDRRELKGAVATLEKVNDAIKDKLSAVESALRSLSAQVAKADAPKPLLSQPLRPLVSRNLPVRPPRPSAALVSNGDFVLKAPHQRVLQSLYWLRDEERTPVKVAFLADYTVNGHFNNVMGELRSAGYVSGWSLTDQGLAWAQSANIEERPTGPQLREWFRPKLSEPENRLVDAAMSTGGERLPVEELAAASGYTVNGHFNNLLGHLRSIEVLEGGAREGVKINDMFLE